MESDNEIEEIIFNENEKNIICNINIFNEKINNAYKIRYGTGDIELREYIGTNQDFLLMFFSAYKLSKYYKSQTIKDEEINRKIFEQLQNIIFELYIIYEFEIFDESPLYKENPENEYEMLYNLNKVQNLIIKTRILWEKVMNFVYLAVERKELNSNKSKKKKFEKWCKDNEINFFDDVLNKIRVFDSKFRTAEVHEFSKLKQYFVKGINQNISLYCLNLLLQFSNETILNIMALLTDQKTDFKMWQKLPEDIAEKIQEFIVIPEWVKKYAKDNKINIDEIGCFVENF